MPAPEYYVLDGDPDNGIIPRRPGIDDVGGADKLNDAEYLPEPGMPDARDDNQHQRLLVGYGKTAVLAAIYIKFVSGAPTIFGIRAMGSEVVAGDFTLTDLGAGKVKIACSANKMPAPWYARAFPQATGNHTGVGYVSGAQEITVEIRTAGAAADVDFVAEWC